jgi:hypothetical protein
MNEDFLHYLWLHHLSGKTFRGTQNEEIIILRPGTHNHNSGPDFFNGSIKIDNTQWAGNIEIHIKSSDWFRHGHQNDPAYESVILHVVYQDDRPVFRANGTPVPTLELQGKFAPKLFETYRRFLLSKQWIPCQDIITRAGHFQILNWLYRLSAERLERKANELEKQLRESKHDFREIFYRTLLQNYGFKTNGEAFGQLARVLPFAVLAKHKDNLQQIEALLFGQAGMLEENFPNDEYACRLQTEYRFLAEKYALKPLPQQTWRFMRMHPNNFPTLRLAQFAGLFYRSTALLQKMLEAERLNDVVSLLQTQASAYWKTHYRFGKTAPVHAVKMGKASIQLILINTVIPFVFVYGRVINRQSLCDKALSWLSLLPPEKNNITRRFGKLGVQAENAMQSQALIRLKTHYCDRKQCLHCAIGHRLLKSL